MNGYGTPNRPVNIMKGILPVASGFDTPPSNLANATNGDPDTPTGVGSKTLDGAGDIGTIIFDLGSAKTFLLGIQLGFWTSANSISVYVQASKDGISYPTSILPFNTGATSEQQRDMNGILLINKRYVKLYANVNGAATGNVKIYEVVGYEKGV